MKPADRAGGWHKNAAFIAVNSSVLFGAEEVDIDTGYSDNYSREVIAASDAVHQAQKNLQTTLQYEYPKDAPVKVVHHRGEYYGFVAGWDYHGCRVIVRNCETQKIKKWWARHVERV